jgi:hypothetical protein
LLRIPRGNVSEPRVGFLRRRNFDPPTLVRPKGPFSTLVADLEPMTTARPSCCGST